jgi:hypothetical protein
MEIVGRYEAPPGKLKRSAFEGECDNATHFVTGLTVGAFTFSAGGSAKVGGGANVGGAGAGGSSSAGREILTRDGDEAECKKAPITDKPPPGCGALIQIEVASFSEEKRCGEGEILVNEECIAKAVPPPTLCKEDEHFENGECVYKPRIVHKARPRVVTPPPPRDEPPPSRPKKPEEKEGQRGTAHAIFAVAGLGGLTVFSVAGLVSLNKAESAFKDGNCNDDTRVCNAEGISAKNTAMVWGWIANVGLGVGAVGMLLFYVWPTQSTQVGASLDGVWMRGRF